MIDEGFVASKVDPCLFFHSQKNIIIITYVNNCLLFYKDPSTLEELIESLKQKYPLTDKDIGNDIYGYLGIEVTMHDK